MTLEDDSQKQDSLFTDLSTFLSGDDFSGPKLEQIVKKHTERLVASEHIAVVQNLLSALNEVARLFKRNAEFELYRVEVQKENSFKSKLEILLRFYPEGSFCRNLRIETLLNSCTTKKQDAEYARSLLVKRDSLKIPTQLSSLSVYFATLPLVVTSVLDQKVEQENDADLAAAAEDKTHYLPSTIQKVVDTLRDLPHNLRTAFTDYLPEKEAPKQRKEGLLTELVKKLAKKLAELSESEIKYFLEDAFLGENGLMHDAAFTQFGGTFFRDIIEGVEANSKERPIPYKEAVIQSGTAFLEALTPELRTEVIITFVQSYLRNADSAFLWERILVDITKKFTFGLKLLQMENLVPPNLRALASSSKEQSDPASKFFVHDLIDKANLNGQYPEIGPVLGSASTATVYTINTTHAADHQATERGQETGQRTCVLKVIKDRIRANFITEKKAFSVAIKVFLETAGIPVSFDPNALLEELSESVAEELDPRNEAFNTKAIGVLRRSHLKSKINIPKIVFKHPDFLIMTLAQGKSLASLQENPISEIDLSKVAYQIVSDFFKQVFKLGVFHTDEHSGNIFLSPTRDSESPQITIIDHGQVGIIESLDAKSMLFKFFIGFLRKDVRLIAATVKKTIDTKSNGTAVPSEKEIVDRLSKGMDSLIDRTLELLVEHDCGYELARFSKGVLSIYSLIEELTPMQKVRIFLPYIREFNLQKEIVSSAISFSVEKIRSIFLGNSAAAAESEVK